MVGVSPCAYPLTHSAAGQSQGIAPTKYQKNCGQVLISINQFLTTAAAEKLSARDTAKLVREGKYHIEADFNLARISSLRSKKDGSPTSLG